VPFLQLPTLGWLGPVYGVAIALWLGLGHWAETHFAAGAEHPEFLALGNVILTGALVTASLYYGFRAVRRRWLAAQSVGRGEMLRWRDVLHTLPDAVYVLDYEGRIIEANPAFYRCLGHDATVAAQLSFTDWHADASSAELLGKLRACGESARLLETKLRRMDGTVCEVEIHASAITLEGRALLLCVARDLSARRAADRACLRAERLCVLRSLTGELAQNLNNTIAPVLLGTELLQTRNLDLQDERLLREMTTAAQRGAASLRKLMVFSSGLPIERLPLPVRPMLAGLAHKAETLFPPGLRVELDYEAALPGVHGDASLLQRVLQNLLENARDAMSPAGHLIIGARTRTLDAVEATRLPSAHAGDYLEIFVRDSGSGLSAEAQEHLFEPFFSTKPRAKAAGLGLATALGIVRSHGGTIEHVAPYGGGAEFRVLLPVTAAAVQNARQPRPDLAMVA
jgi:two-component system, cell cycle sensor histidine kinase and response regulator CckA